MLDPDLLRTFVAVAETRSFTAAAQRLDLSQSTVSGHIRRLEERLGRPLVARTTHAVALTPNGESLLDLARGALEAGERLARFAAGAAGRERLRFGVCDDFSLSSLPGLLDRFLRVHAAAVDLELTVGLSVPITERHDAGALDVALVKRRPGDARGALAWRDRLVWGARPGYPPPDPGASLPVLAFPPPSITRRLATGALERAGRDWHCACTSDSLSGLHAGALSGLGVVPHAASLMPAALRAIAAPGLPPLPDVDFILLGGASPAARALGAVVLAEIAAGSVAGA